LVIASHAFPLVRELPWTIKRFSNLGFFGVQLFFVVSCFTLARSWRQRAARQRPSVRDFLARRFFRIAPAFYLAALFYAWWRPGDFDGLRVLTLASFTNGWTPSQMPTVPGVWEGVPGGWSIAAEFSFYALFPLMIVFLRGVRSALLAMLVSLPLAWLANRAGWWAYAAADGAKPTDQFLYYWLPNQMPVFLCGLLLHEIVARITAASAARTLPLPQGEGAFNRADWWRVGAYLTRNAGALLGAALLLFASLAFLPPPRQPLPEFGFVAAHVVAAIAFAMAALALSARQIPLVVNRPIVWLGQASFSAYLLHFAVLDALRRVLPAAALSATGVTAILVSLVVFALTLALTFALAQATYRLIELPGIRLGARLLSAATAPR
jgi:peptidoglycan/LPS O-acetylase OafA/YrhL